MIEVFSGFNFADLYAFIHDIILLILIFRCGDKNNTAAAQAKGKRL